MISKILLSKINGISKKYPHKTAVEDPFSMVNYDELRIYSNQIGHCLIENDVRKGDIVAIYGESCINYIATLIGINKAGGVFLPLEVSFPTNRLCGIVKEVVPRIVVTNPNQVNSILSIVRVEQAFSSIKKIIVVKELNSSIVIHDINNGKIIGTHERQFNSNNIDLYIDPNDSNYLIYTSGSTGIPKIIEGCHKSLNHFIRWQAEEFELTCENRICQFAPISFDVSLRDIFIPLTIGGTLCIPAVDTKTNVSRFLDWLIEKEITLLHIVPSMFRLLTRELQTHTEKINQLSLQYVFFAGEALYGKDVDQWISICGDTVEFINLYGPSETTLAKAFYVVRGSNSSLSSIIPLGKPISDTAILILKKNQLCNKLEIGEIFIKTPYMSKGYYNNPELTAQSFVQNPLHNDYKDILYKTGDIGRYLEDWNVEFIGRYDHQIKIHGNRLELMEIEKLVMEFENISQALVQPISRDAGELILVCYYVDDQKVDENELRIYLASYLPEYACPSIFIRLDEFPLTLNGKIDKKSLPKPEELYLNDKDFEAPQTTLEIDLAKIWSEILRINTVGLNYSFFQLGGNSLSAIQIMSRIYKVLGYEIKLREFFDHPTVKLLSEFISSQQSNLSTKIQAIQEKEYYDVSFAQRRMCILSQIPEANAAYNISRAYILSGAIDLNLLEEAINMLLIRHESLRTIFIQKKEDFYQKIVFGEKLNLAFNDLTDNDDKNRLCHEIALDVAIQPFDLDIFPLIRAHVIKMGPERHLLLITIHHIISDGWSMGVLFQELLDHYYNFSAKKRFVLPQLEFHYKEYSQWQRNKLGGGDMEKSREFWKKKLGGNLPVLDLKTDFLRPQIKSYKGKEITFSIGEEAYKKIKNIITASGSSTYMFLLASLKTLLYHYTGQVDIILGTTLAGRENKDLENQIGFYVNTLALRTQFRSSDSFYELLLNIRSELLDAYEHQSYPFDFLLDDISINHTANRNPVFDVMVNMATEQFVNEQIDVSKLNGLSVKEYKVDHTSSKYDLTFTFYERTQELRVTIEYDTDLFQSSSIKRMGKHFVQLVSAITNDVHNPLHSYTYLCEEEAQIILKGFNASSITYPHERTIQGLFEDQVRNSPNSIALVCGEQHLTYAELNIRSNRLAHYLRENYTISQEEVLGLMVDRSEWLIIGILGILKAGGCYL
ncbi:MAG: amino acid adenylation domain-containing protein, partial [Cytophagales bacterium]|nr:amino acid adenylation domain-containing protein [Cytophagales bacterium]